jgi:hypothetical protein
MCRRGGSMRVANFDEFGRSKPPVWAGSVRPAARWAVGPNVSAGRHGRPAAGRVRVRRTQTNMSADAAPTAALTPSASEPVADAAAEAPVVAVSKKPANVEPNVIWVSTKKRPQFYAVRLEFAPPHVTASLSSTHVPPYYSMLLSTSRISHTVC